MGQYFSSACRNTPLLAITRTLAIVSVYEIFMRSNPSLGNGHVIKLALACGGIMACFVCFLVDDTNTRNPNILDSEKANFWTVVAVGATATATDYLFNLAFTLLNKN